MNCIHCAKECTSEDIKRILRRHSECFDCGEKIAMDKVEKGFLEQAIKEHKGNIDIQLYDSHFIRLDFDKEKNVLSIQLTKLAMNSIKDYPIFGSGSVIFKDIPNPFKEEK
jgi:hypothetical protein